MISMGATQSTQTVEEVYNFPICLRPFWSEVRPQVQLRAPVLPPRGGLGHHRVDADRAQRLGDLFHLARAALAVDDDAADRVVRELLPVDAGPGLLERGK